MSHGASSVNGDEGDASENEEFLRNVIDQTMAEVDKDNSGTISFEEFKNVRVGTPPHWRVPPTASSSCVVYSLAYFMMRPLLIVFVGMLSSVEGALLSHQTHSSIPRLPR